MKNIRKDTPSEFYRLKRPEYFSDSETIYDIVLSKEQLAFELSQITTNQKQDEFENLCRKLSEKTISPNLIPQVGPTGGGDGKTDSETYPVSDSISNRWFIPEQGWKKDEKWAFAISAKSTWKSKVESDIKKIIGTKRKYTRIYFITNQTPSSKKKKEAQDEFIEKYGLDIVILDGTWILEKVYDNNLLDIVIDSLNMSNVLKNKKTFVGENDASRLKKLKEIEENIQNPKRYFEYDFQLVEDALESAILSRELEKPRDEIEGKFDRAIRFCKKMNSNKQWIRIHYQRAWTYLYYYDDYSAFIEEYKKLKKFISKDSSISELELYVNLYTSLIGAYASNCNLTDFKINLSKEREDLYSILDKFTNKENKPCSSLIARFYKTLEELMNSVILEKSPESPESYINEISNHFIESKGLIDFPFQSFKTIIEEIGLLFPTIKKFDNLIDIIASIDEKRTSELTAGQTFLKRAGQKFMAKQYKDSIVYFGKSVLKLAKEESNDGLYLALKGLGHAYHEIGLLWASNNCFISASSIAFKSWYEKGVLDNRVYDCAKYMSINEQIIGRVPNFLAWNELFNIISSQVDTGEEEDEIPVIELMDAFLSIRALNTNDQFDNLFSYLPDVLEEQSLFLAKNAVLFKLGYTDLILKDYEKANIKSEEDLGNHFELIASQPFRNQMLYETNFMDGNEVKIVSNVLGCKFTYTFEKDLELLFAAETFAAYFESFLATSLKDMYPNTEEIKIKLVKNIEQELFHFTNKGKSNEYEISINKLNYHKDKFKSLWSKQIEFVSHILATNFFIKNPYELLENLLKEEEINERLGFVFEHRNSTVNVLGDNAKLFFADWIKSDKNKVHPSKRTTPFKFTLKEEEQKDKPKPFNFEETKHTERKVISIIDNKLWNEATWKGFGPIYHRQMGFGLCLVFENGVSGRAIFDDWINRFGKEDENELIKITIVKGTNRNNPFWYSVHITSNIEKKFLKHKEHYFSVTARLFGVISRIHEMKPINSNNLKIIEDTLKTTKKFLFCPALISTDGSKIEPYFDKSIIKKDIKIKNAWEIGLHDIERSVIKTGDEPLIPENIKNAPVLEILKKRSE